MKPDDKSQALSCCNNTTETTCCQGELGVAQGWMIGFGVISALVIVFLMFLCCYNKLSSLCVKRATGDTHRKKLGSLHQARKVSPIEKMNLLQTVNYTVNANWDQLRVRFHDTVFFDNFCQALFSRYRDATWKEFGREKRAEVTCSSGSPVSLRLLQNVQLVIASKVGNYYWVMNDFQNICKNLQSSDRDSQRMTASRLQPLTPRSATVGEQRFDEGDYFVNICPTELEVKFAYDWLYHNFMRALTFENSESMRSGSHGDYVLFKVGNEKSVTLYIWEEAQTLWISGEGKKDWFANDFHKLLEAARVGFIPERNEITFDFPPDEANETTPEAEKTKSNEEEYSAIYTVKSLDSGGYELEFPNIEFLISLKKQIQKVYPSIRWREYSSRHITKVTYACDKTVSIHIADPESKVSCMWLYDPGCSEWFNGEFRHIYGATYGEHFSTIGKGEAVVKIESETGNETRI